MVKKKKAAKKATIKKTILHSAKTKPSRVHAVVEKVKEALAPKTERVEVTILKKTLGKAPEEFHFVLRDGRRLKSLYDLVDEFETMSEDVFHEYVTDARNDFANWTKDVFSAPDLADELHRLKSKFETQKAIMKHMLRDVQKAVEHVQKSGQHK